MTQHLGQFFNICLRVTRYAVNFFSFVH